MTTPIGRIHRPPRRRLRRLQSKGNAVRRQNLRESRPCQGVPIIGTDRLAALGFDGRVPVHGGSLCGMSRGIVRLKLLRRCRARGRAGRLSMRACGLGRGAGGHSAVWPVEQVLDCLICPLLLNLDLFMAWVLRR